MFAPFLGSLWLKALGIGLVLLVIGGTILTHVSRRQAERERQVAAAFIQGEAIEQAKWIAARAEEQARQREINAKAMAAANAEVARLRAQNLTLEKAVEELSHAADQDPDRDLRILGPDSLRMLDRIR